jgi:hypothetical protein
MESKVQKLVIIVSFRVIAQHLPEETEDKQKLV